MDCVWSVCREIRISGPQSSERRRFSKLYLLNTFTDGWQCVILYLQSFIGINCSNSRIPLGTATKQSGEDEGEGSCNNEVGKGIKLAPNSRAIDRGPFSFVTTTTSLLTDDVLVLQQQEGKASNFIVYTNQLIDDELNVLCCCGGKDKDVRSFGEAEQQQNACKRNRPTECLKRKTRRGVFPLLALSFFSFPPLLVLPFIVVLFFACPFKSHPPRK